jgi:alkyldihydroxyacetonephosphate synthase
MLDEGDAHITEATRQIVDEECIAADASVADVAFVEQWLGHRNDVSALEALISKGFVVDTMEVSGSWRVLPEIYSRTIDAIRGVEHTMAASAHQSHSYADGGCLYFTFAGRAPEDEREAYYRAVWDAGQRAVLAAGGALSHHHGVGLNRSRFVSDALGTGFDVLQSVKDALDPNGILNPGKLGLRNPFGELVWP